MWCHFIWCEERRWGPPDFILEASQTSDGALWNKRYGEIGSKIEDHGWYFLGETKKEIFFFFSCSQCGLAVIHWVSGHSGDRTRQGGIVVTSEKGGEKEKEKEKKSLQSLFQDFPSSTKVLDRRDRSHSDRCRIPTMGLILFSSYLKITSVYYLIIEANKVTVIKRSDGETKTHGTLNGILVLDY